MFDKETAASARKSIDEQREKYLKSYAREEVWTSLAKKFELRLPPYYARPSDQDIKFWLKSCYVPYVLFVDTFGWKDADSYEKSNPNHGMKPLAGLILELAEALLKTECQTQENAQASSVILGKDTPPKQRTYKGKSKAKRREEER